MISCHFDVIIQSMVITVYFGPNYLEMGTKSCDFGVSSAPWKAVAVRQISASKSSHSEGPDKHSPNDISDSFDSGLVNVLMKTVLDCDLFLQFFVQIEAMGKINKSKPQSEQKLRNRTQLAKSFS